MKKTLLCAVAFLAACVWLYLVLVVFAGFMAARAVPVGYFSFFGRAHTGLALFLVDLALHAVPNALLLGGGAYLLAKLVPSNPRFGLLSAVAGFVVAYGLIFAALNPAFDPSMVFWWGAPGIAAPWLGAFMAWRFLERRFRVGAPVTA